MSQRLWLPTGGTPPLPSRAFGATGNTWNKTTLADRLPAVATKSNTALANSTRAGNGINPSNVLTRQYQIVLPFAITLSGSVKGIARCNEAANTANVFSQVLIYVVSGDGLTERGVALAFDNSALSNEWPTTAATRAFPRDSLPGTLPGDTLTDTVCQANDVLIMEIGFRHESTATTSQTIVFGDNQAADHDWNAAASTSNTLNPWIEFSMNILDDPGAAPSEFEGWGVAL